MYNMRSMVMLRVQLSADVDDGLSDRIGGTDDLRVGLEVTLSGNQIDQLLGDIDIGRFQCARLNQTEARGARLANQRAA